MEQLTKRLYERVLGAEMTHYLGYEKVQAPKLAAGQGRENHRNGTSKKMLVSEEGNLEIEVPRDRPGKFEPHFIRKGQRRFGGFDSKIIAMYGQGMAVREILLRRHGPVPGILAARRPGATMDKSERPRLTNLNVL